MASNHKHKHNHSKEVIGIAHHAGTCSLRGERYAASATHQNHRVAAISSMIREGWAAWEEAVDGARAHRDKMGLGIRSLWRQARAHRCTVAAALVWAWVLVLVVVLPEVGIAGPETGRAPSASTSNSPVISTVANATSHAHLLAAWVAWRKPVHLTRGPETGSVLHALICSSHATPPAASARHQSLTMLE